jgi:hypothetical protein
MSARERLADALELQRVGDLALVTDVCAEVLRLLGWTCTPPSGKAGAR